jgi:hypothetical protein
MHPFVSDCAPKRARSVLTDEQAVEIFRLKFTSHQSARPPPATHVAKWYGVSEKTIRDIWKGRTWRLETWHLDTTRPFPDKQRGRPIGSKDRRPRTVRRTAIDDDTNTAIVFVSSQVTQMHTEDASSSTPGSGPTTHHDDAGPCDGHASETTPREWGRTCVDEEIQGTQQASTIDWLLQEWADAPSGAPDCYDPFRDDWSCGETWSEDPCFERYAYQS